MRQGTLRIIAGALLALALTVGIAACGSSKKSDSTTTSSTASTSSSSAGAAQPGKGKPAVTLGTKNFTEQFVLGQLYKQALEAKGYTVNLKQNIGSTEIADKALRSGQIDLYPEYIGIFDSVVAGDTTVFPTAEAAYAKGQTYAQSHGFTLLPLTPFTDTDALAVKPDYATKHNLQSIGDLKAIKGLRLGAAPEFRNRPDGLPGLKKHYGITGVAFSPLTIGLQYQALDDGKVDVADVFTTDGQLQNGKYVVLADPQNNFGFQNVAPVLSEKVQTAEGPDFSTTLDAVSQKLTTRAMQQMNAAVALDKQSPADVAKQFLQANGLL